MGGGTKGQNSFLPHPDNSYHIPLPKMLVTPSVLIFSVLFALLNVPICSFPIGTRAIALLSQQMHCDNFGQRFVPKKIGLSKRSVFARDRYVNLSQLTTSRCPAEYLTSSPHCTNEVCMLCFLCERDKYLPSRENSLPTLLPARVQRL